MQRIFLLTVLFFLLQSTTYSQNVGIGTTDPVQPLDVNGNIRLTGALMPNGSSGTSGQVLMSNGSNTAATWRNMAFSNTGRAFAIPIQSTRTETSIFGRGANWNITGTANQSDTVDIGNQYVSGDDVLIISPGGGAAEYFLATRSGLFHFEGAVRFILSCDLDVGVLPGVGIRMSVTQPTSLDPIFHLVEQKMEQTGGSVAGDNANTFSSLAKFSIDIHLQAGSTISFLADFNRLKFPHTGSISTMGYLTGGYLNAMFIAD